METTSKSWIKLTDDNFQAEVLESERPVLVDFWADWCGPCHALAPTIEELADEYRGTVKVGKMELDENPRTADTTGILSIPAVFLYRNGEVVDTLVGVQPKEAYVAALDRLTGER
jgi:thioredoxin 1